MALTFRMRARAWRYSFGVEHLFYEAEWSTREVRRSPMLLSPYCLNLHGLQLNCNHCAEQRDPTRPGSFLVIIECMRWRQRQGEMRIWIRNSLQRFTIKELRSLFRKVVKRL